MLTKRQEKRGRHKHAIVAIIIDAPRDRKVNLGNPERQGLLERTENQDYQVCRELILQSRYHLMENAAGARLEILDRLETQGSLDQLDQRDIQEALELQASQDTRENQDFQDQKARLESPANPDILVIVAETLEIHIKVNQVLWDLLVILVHLVHLATEDKVANRVLEANLEQMGLPVDQVKMERKANQAMRESEEILARTLNIAHVQNATRIPTE